MRNHRLVIDHVSLVKKIAAHLAARQFVHFDVEDLVGAGMIGLMRAASNYRPAHGVPFRAFAQYRIRGEMLDFIARDLRQVHAGVVDDDEPEAVGRRDPCPRAPKDAGRMVAIALRELSPRMRGVIVMRFVDDKSHKAIGRRLGVGDSRVWQIQREALDHMRRTLRLYQIDRLEDVL